MKPWPLGLVLFLFAAPAAAQPYEISWYTIDGGGATFSVGGTYSLGATIGQPDASGPLTGGSYTVVGGFWAQALNPGIQPVDLTLSLSDTPDPVTGNQTLTYTLGVANLGPGTATDVTLSQNLPGVVSLESIMGPGWMCGEAGGVVTCTRSGLAVGAAPDVIVQVRVPPAGGTLLSDASVDVAPEPDSNLANNQASASTTVLGIPYADVSVTKTDNGAIALWNRYLTYVFTVSNGGPNSVSGATVTDTFHASLTGVTWTCTASVGSSCAPSGAGHISDSTVNLLPGGTATYTARGRVVWGTMGPIPNSASVSLPIFDPSTANNLSSIDTPVNTDLIFMDGFEP
jgi:uncharacterized repeat protein (TIGR01451 family)